ncbi:MAG: MFS transporter [Pseudomonadota bacterium]
MSLFRFDAAFREELKADWPVLLLAVCCLLFGFSAPTFALPFLFSEVISEFGWTREQATLLASAKFLVGAVAALAAGRCLDVVGVRAALIATIGIGGAALVSLFFVHDLTTYYLAGVLMGLAGPGTMVAVQILVSRTFHASQGTAIGAALMGTSIGSIVVPLVIAALISALGWRIAFPALSLGVWLVIMPMLLFFMPKERAPTSPAAIERATHVGSASLLDAWKVMKTTQFALLAGATFLTSLIDQGFIQHQVLILQDANLSRESAAWAVSAIGMVGIVCRILVGNILDSTSNKGLSFLYGTLTLTALTAFYLVNPMILMAFVVVRAAGHATVLIDTTVMNKHVFGLKNFGTMVGVFTAITSVGFAVGPWLMGRLYDMNGNYHAVFALFCVLPLAAAAMTWFLKPTFWRPLSGREPVVAPLAGD